MLNVRVNTGSIRSPYFWAHVGKPTRHETFEPIRLQVEVLVCSAFHYSKLGVAPSWQTNKSPLGGRSQSHATSLAVLRGNLSRLAAGTILWNAPEPVSIHEEMWWHSDAFRRMVGLAIIVEGGVIAFGRSVSRCVLLSR